MENEKSEKIAHVLNEQGGTREARVNINANGTVGLFERTFPGRPGKAVMLTAAEALALWRFLNTHHAVISLRHEAEERRLAEELPL